MCRGRGLRGLDSYDGSREELCCGSVDLFDVVKWFECLWKVWQEYVCQGSKVRQ